MGHGEELIYQHGSLVEIIDAITNKLLILPEDTIVYPRAWKIHDDKRRKTNLFGVKRT
ncbi:MAG: hypothetical protein HFJ27_03585 [Clostridia bacterium]|nr:hypothetical protein [Clostridia bacterium]